MTETTVRRILFVLAGTFGSNGGMYEYFKATLDECLDDGDQVAICCSKEICDSIDTDVEKFPLFQKEPPPSYRSLILSREFRKQQLDTMVSAILSAAGKFNAEIVHFTDITLYSDYLIKGLTNSKDFTLIQTLHDPKFHEEKISLPLFFLKRLQYRRLVQIFSTSDRHSFHVHDERLLQGTNFPPSTNFVFKGHPLPKRRLERTRAFLESKIRVGFLGRIEPYKGLDDLHSALMLLLESDNSIGERIEVFIVGNGPLELAKWKSLPCSVEVINRYITDEEFHQQMANLDLLVLPYRTATQSGVLAMALTYAVPTIATNVGAIDQMVFHRYNGLLVLRSSPPELAEALRLVFTSSTFLEDLRRNALKMNNMR